MNPLLEKLKTLDDDDKESMALVESWSIPYLEELDYIRERNGKGGVDESTRRRFMDGFITGVNSRLGCYTMNRTVPTAPWASQAAIRRAWRWANVLWNYYCDFKLAEEPSILTDKDIRKRIRQGDKKWANIKRWVKETYFIGFRDGDFLASRLISDPEATIPTLADLRKVVDESEAMAKL